MATGRAENELEMVVNGRRLAVRDPVLSGRQIRTAADLHPASDYLLIQLVGRGSRSIGLDEDVDLRDGKAVEFRAFEGDRTYNFTIDELGQEWGASTISESDLRRLAGITPEHELLLDSDRDAPIADGQLIALDSAGTERIVSRKRGPKTVTIIVNAREKIVTKGELSFDDIIRLAFDNPPSGPQVAFTVTYRKGPADKPEGSLIQGATVQVREGMVFNARFTDKS